MSGIDNIDKSNLEDIIDLIPSGHLTLTRLEKNLEKNIIDMQEFYFKTDEDQKKTGIPYQYNPKHQKEWSQNWIPIVRQFSAVDRLVMEKYERLFSLEIAKQQGIQNPQQQMPAGMMPAIVQNLGQQQKESRFKWPSFGKKAEPPSVTPFKLSVQEILKKHQIKNLFYEYIDFHEHMVEYAMQMDYGEELGLRLNWMGYSGLMELLSVERSEFTVRAKLAVTIISEGYETVRDKEKKQAVDVLTSATQLKEKHANQFM